MRLNELLASPAPSNASSATFRPAKTPGPIVTHGGPQMKKKKVKRVVDSDEEGGGE